MLSVIILAAGKGERMRPLTSTRPKPLLPVVLGETLLDRWIRSVNEKASEIIVVAKEKIDIIAEHLKERYPDVKLVEQGEEKGTGAALRYGLKATRGDEVLVIFSDIYLQRPKENLERLLKEVPSLLAYEVDDVSQFGALRVENGIVKEVLEKKGKGRGLIFAGLMVAKKSELVKVLDNLNISERGEYELTQAIPSLEMKPVKVEGGWVDVGRPWDVFEVSKLEMEIIDGMENPWGPGKIYGTKPKVKGDVYVEGPVFFGEDVEIGPYSHIRPYTVLLKGVKVGPFVQIKNSYVMEYSRLPHLNYIGDSVVAEDVNFGAGSITANLRFDERPVKVTLKGERVNSGRRKLGAIVGAHARIGINVSLMPGVKVGAYSWIYPGCVVTRDVEDGERYKCW
ncbi:nucleotidyltransferase [Ignicoccus pacificus DSM 13166]|uniref:Nucleotidyltransferase n=1 Tax=Ignicoccus pacificus DSM 13166 TaxID=940294 RepID=A0A977K8U9_9CREN|nr:nucleotidyltransferase [Ignicoccus pacificus DSM 13166]